MKGTLEKYFVFLLSPFLSIPLILKDIYKRKGNSLVLLACIFGILSYAYIPAVTNDKAYYYLLFQNFKFYDFIDFTTFLADKPDFIFYFLIFLFAKIGISIQVLFLLLTSITVGTWLYSFNTISNKYNLLNKEYFLFFMLVLFSFSLPYLLSGTRNYLSFSFVLLAFLKGIIESRKKVGLFFILLSIFIHFSSFLFLPVYLLLVFYPAKQKWYKLFFLISFIFLFIPREFLFDIATNLNLSGVYKTKIEAYLDEEGFIENSISTGNINNYLRIFFYGLWTYLAYIYIFITFKRKSLLRNIVLVTFGVAHIFYAAPTTYFRFLLIPQIFFILLLIYEYSEHRNLLKYSRILLIILFLNFFGNIYASRGQYLKSYWDISSLTFITIFMEDNITPKDFIR